MADAGDVALTEALGTQLRRLKGGGPKKIRQVPVDDPARPRILHAPRSARCPTARRRSPSTACDA